MRSYNAVPGLLCAARFNGAWHRAMVVERYKPDKTVKVSIMILEYAFCW